MRTLIFILAGLVLAIPCEANPIPVPPPASMPLEDMHIQIQAVDGQLHATFTGEFTFNYIPEDVQSMLFPLPPDADNIGVWQDGSPLAWAWTAELYPTILPEIPTIPMIGWPGPFPLGGAVFRVDYEHNLIKRPTEFIFFYASGTGKYFPTYDKTTTAYFDIELPVGYAVAGVWLDETPHQYQILDGHLMVTVESLFGPITNDLIVSLVPATIYVATDGDDVTGDGSEQNPFRTIQKGIDTAADGGTVIVQPGTYTGAGNRDIDFLGKAITVRSQNGPQSCVIDCDATYEDNHRGVYFVSSEDANSILDGFTITNGYVVVECEGGAAIYCYQSCPTIRNCVITHNTALLHPQSRCVCYGGGIYVGQSSPTITHCVISGNAVGRYGLGAGVACHLQGRLTLNNCTISTNTAYGDHSEGAGIYCGYTAALTIINCTVAGNATSGSAGGIYLDDSTDFIALNSIVWGNSANQIFDRGAGSPAVTACDVQGGWPGDGNIDADPCFAKLGYWDANGTPEDHNDDFLVAGDYHLKSQGGRWDPNSESWVLDDVTSPCIDKGHWASPIGDEPYPNGGVINMGAYGGTAEASKSPAITCWEAAECAGQPFGDATCSGIVNLAALFALKSNFGKSAPWSNPECCADFDHNGVVNLADLYILKKGWKHGPYSPATGNQNCPP
jgi:hypothetical protein